MASKSESTFSELVCGAASVRTAFKGQGAIHFWWQVILLLHGKPRDSSVSERDRIQCIANGFQFYAWLYRMLAVIFLSLSLILSALKISLADNGTWYWCVASFLAAVYLWLVSGLGYAGASAYRRSEGNSITILIAFMIMIVAFLSLFLSAASVTAYHSHWLATAPNLGLGVMVFAFGIGSYFIEIVYLITDSNLQMRHRGL